MKVKFPKKGTYTVLCSLHTGHEGQGRGEGQEGRHPVQEAGQKRIKKQSKAASKLAKKLVAGQGVPTGATVKAGNDKKGVATLAFFPAKKTVKVGQQVTFTMSNKSTEAHNVAFGPEAYAAELAQAFIGPAGLDPRTVYPSEPFGTALVRNGTSHGNGYVNTGLLDDDKATPMPKSTAVSFSKPGRTSTTASSTGPR